MKVNHDFNPFTPREKKQGVFRYIGDSVFTSYKYNFSQIGKIEMLRVIKF